MRHYEIMIVVHPDQSEQVAAMIDKYKSIIEGKDGKIHRLEDWGRRQMAYMMIKAHKGHYILMNVECSEEARRELQDLFKYNDAILRSIIIKMKAAVTEPSAMLQERDERKDVRPNGSRPGNGERRERQDDQSQSNDYHHDDEQSSD